MNKHLLLGSALLFAVSAYPQAGKLVKPSGVREAKTRVTEYDESAPHKTTPGTGPIKGLKKPTTPINAKIMATATRFTGSMNAFGVIVPESKTLGYNQGVGAVTFVHRKSPTYTASSNSNSGSIVAMVSTNAGTTWDSTCFWANGTDWARYPQGGIYNPLGNTNINNAYIVGMGPFTIAAGGWNGTAGAWYASKQLNAFNNMPGSDQQSFTWTGGVMKSHYMSRYSFSPIDGGLVRSIAMICNDPMATTNAAFGLRGAWISKGQFNAGSFIWSGDSLIFPTTMHSGGYKNLTGLPVMAWSEDGQIGYAIMIGSRASETISPTYVNSKGGYQPIVFKTTNSGASWGLLPANDFADQVKFKGVWDRLYPLNTNTTVTTAYFNWGEDFDATVDFNGQLHIASTAYGHYYNHTDSLGYRYVFGAEQYSWDFSGSYGYPIIYDFYTTPTGWDYHMVDSMGTEGPSGTSGQPGFNTNVWADGSGGKLDLPARIQMSRSTDGKQIFYSWSESDSAIIGTKWNIGPNIMTRGFDVTIDKVTPKYNVTSTISIPTNISGGAFFHYMGTEAINTGANWEIPFTISTNGTYDGGQPMDHYYIKGATIPTNAFTLNPMRPTGVASLAKAIENSDVTVYPNPASGSATLMINLKEAKAFEVNVYNTIGQLIQTIPVNGELGSNGINMDLSKLNKGVYFCNVKSNGAVITKKLIVE
jgi:hypothetical protein